MEEEIYYVNISVLNDQIEARLLEAILKERSIPHDILSYHDTAYDGIFQIQKGWGVVRGYDSDREVIETILADIRNPDSVDFPEPGDKEDAEEGEEEPEG